MSWRSHSQRTGENAAPLGNARRWGGGDASPPSQSSAPAPGNGFSSGLPPIPTAAAAAANRAAEIAARLAGGGSVNPAAAEKRDREDGSGSVQDDGGEYHSIASCPSLTLTGVRTYLLTFLSSVSLPFSSSQETFSLGRCRSSCQCHHGHHWGRERSRS